PPLPLHDALPISAFAPDGAALPPPDGCCPPAQAASKIAKALANTSAKRAERIGGLPPPDRPGLVEDTSARYARFSVLGAIDCGVPVDDLLAALLDALAALLSECWKKRPALAHDLAPRGTCRHGARRPRPGRVRRIADRV